jgi:hypothetical protein
MTETEMREVAPSIFAVSAHESRSERFKLIPTISRGAPEPTPRAPFPPKALIVR